MECREEQEDKKRASHVYRLPALRGESGRGRRRANADAHCISVHEQCLGDAVPYVQMRISLRANSLPLAICGYSN